MEDDDTQDELINRSTSHSKGKRPVLWSISDDSDDVQEESDEGESDSSDEDEDHINGEEEEEEGNEEADATEEEDVKPVEGAFGETSADFAGMSSDDDSDKCPICLNSFSSQPVATPEDCEHYFCLDCILEWAKNANSCPVDRIAFNNIYLRKCYGGKVKKMITVQKPVKQGQEETVNVDLEQTNCEVCGGSDREDRLLLCDGCDAGYHMECLTPPLDSVPVEEWFCPQCEANNRPSRGSAEEHSDAESLPSTARSSISRSQPRAAGPTRAIARTQQSERVRANVNRHRITQARTSQLAPTYLIQSTWLDDTINAVVAGLNTSVYIRDFTTRVSSRTRRRRNNKSKKTSSTKGKTSKAPSGGLRRKRRRRVRRTKSRQKQMLKKTATPKSRIANSLGIVKDKKSSSLPTVYRPSEQTLSSMRADIGAASLSIYGDPFDLDPFVDREEGEQGAHVTSLLEAKRRGISRSALRSHQPVARPVAASLSRRGVEVHQPRVVAEAAPVPDLLGSILSGQSVLLMDSSDVVINRDGSLKATKSTMSSTLNLGGSNSSVPGDASAQNNPGIMSSPGESSPSHHYNTDLPGLSHSSIDRPWAQNFDHSPSFMAYDHTQPHPQSPLTSRSRQSLQPSHPNRPTPFPGQRGASDVALQRESLLSSIQPLTDSLHSKNKGMSSSQPHPKKAPIKPMWQDVSVLPRIPKIKRGSNDVTNDGTSRGSTNAINGSRGGSNISTTDSNGYTMPVTGMVSLAGDKGRQQSVDHKKGPSGHSQRHRPDGAGPSSAFSSSFSSSSSSSTSYPANHPRYSSSSSAVSFRINSSGNSWHSRRLSNPSFSASGASTQEPWREKEEEAKKRQLHKDKQMLLASRTTVNKEQDNIYDPFNPTLSDSSSSDGEAESLSLDGNSQHATHKDKAKLVQSKLRLVQVKTETQEVEVSQDEPKTDAQESISQEIKGTEECVKVKKELVHTKAEQKHIPKIKKEPGVDDAGESEKSQTAHPGFHILKTEKDTLEKQCGQSVRTPNTVPSSCKNDSFTSSTSPTKKKTKPETKSVSALCSQSLSGDLSLKRKSSKTTKEQGSSSSETDTGRRAERQASGQEHEQKEKVKGKAKSSRRSGSRERRRTRSVSKSSYSSSPERTRRKRRRSQSKDRGRSRSLSSCSSGERSKKKEGKQKSKERIDVKQPDRERELVSKDRRRGRSHSTSQSRSRSRSRSRSKDRKRRRSTSREKRKDHRQLQQPSFSSRHEVESPSKDKRKHMSTSSDRKQEDTSSRNSQKKSGSCSSSSKATQRLQHKQKEENVQSSLKEPSFAKVKKRPCFTSTGGKEGKHLRASIQLSASEMTKDMAVVKTFKKERQPSVDMFEDSLITAPLKKEQEQIDISSVTIPKCTYEEEIKEDSIKAVKCEIKTETLEITPVKTEPGSPETCPLSTGTSFSTLTTPLGVNVKTLDEVSQPPPGSVISAETAALTVSVKQEAQPLSDSDEDFNVDVMLDSLDYVKSEHTEGNSACVKHEKEGEEEKFERDGISAVVGAKSKTQVKRVTWNIQEPEGPQPEKSASKVALYKLKLKQEGVRRPSSTVPASTQDVTSAVSDLSTASRSDVHPEGLPGTGQEEAEEGDLLKKDKYLKKLHMQERAIEEVKVAIKPFYQRRDINKDEYKEILRKAVHKVCHSKSGEINPVKVGNLVKAYVDKYKHARKHTHKKGDDLGKAPEVQTETHEEA